MSKVPQPLGELLGTVGEVMSEGVVVLRPDMGLEAAVRALERRGVGGGPVVDERGRLVGIASMRDLFSVLPDRRLRDLRTTGPFHRKEHILGEFGARANLTVADVMTKNVVTVPVDLPSATAAVVMTENAVDRLPVVEADGTVVGIVTRHDILKALAEAVRRQAGPPGAAVEREGSARSR